MPANLENSSVATVLEKVSFHSSPKKRQCQRMFKLLHNCTYLTRLKILQARLQPYMNHELPNVQAGFRKGRGTRNQTSNICWINKKAKEFQKNIYFCLLTMPKPLTVWIMNILENSSRDGNTRPPDLPLEKSVCRSGSNS